jgi:hypothetical protein
MTPEDASPPERGDFDPAEMPPFAEDALVLKVGDPVAVQRIVNAYREGHHVIPGLGGVLDYVDRFREDGAKLTPVYPERALDVMPESPVREGGWQVALPDWGTPRQAMSAYHFLQLATSEKALGENAALEASLRADPQIRLVYHPAIPYAIDPPAQGSKTGLSPQWALDRCGFPDAWKCLEHGFDPGPIGVIDVGGNVGHQELSAVQVFPPDPVPSAESHASGVVGVLAAPRDGIGMDGCCSAQVQLYNVAPAGVLDKSGFILALKAVACKGLRVVNVSLEMADDQLVRDQVRECMGQGMIMVAGMGNRGTNVPSFPAAYPGVIAVGATNRSDVPLKLSNRGKHVWLCAPGAFIFTINDATTIDTDHNGTSYATPMVSAAAWLTLRVRPAWTRRQVKSLLARSVDKRAQHSNQRGHGRLDMRKLIEELQCGTPEPCPPDEL